MSVNKFIYAHIMLYEHINAVHKYTRTHMYTQTCIHAYMHARTHAHTHTQEPVDLPSDWRWLLSQGCCKIHHMTSQPAVKVRCLTLDLYRVMGWSTDTQQGVVGGHFMSVW